MNPPECDKLDDYLAGWLSDDEAADFEAHLAGCRACRRETGEQHRIDRLLAEGTGQLEPLPFGLLGSIDGELRSLRRCSLIRGAAGLSTAAAILLAVALWYTLHNGGVPPEPERIAEKPVAPEAGEHEIAPPPQSVADGQTLVRVRFSDPSDAILVPLETDAPNVSIVWVYPTVKPAPVGAGPAAESP